MLLKRKRSDDELSCFSSSGIGYSSPMRSETGDVVMMDMDIHSPTAMLSPMSRSSTPSHRSSTPSHLHSRTFKRLRNGRPSDEEVHQNTMKLLYQAQHQQHQQPHHTFTPPASASPMPMPTAPLEPKQQPSLHSFWKNLPAPNTPPQQQQVATPTILGENNAACEDCGVGLGEEEEDAMMDDGAGYGFETYINACSACARVVCFSCSVSNLGEQRRCLRCAGRDGAAEKEKKKTWIGGLGWSSGGLSVY